MPQDTWPITKDDKAEMQKLGRELLAFLKNYFKDHDRVHLKLIIGAFNYVVDLQTQKTKLIGDDFKLLDETIKRNNLEEFIEEPYEPEPEVAPPTIADRRKFHEEEIEKLNAEEAVENASPAPADSPAPDTALEAPAPVVPPTEGPANA